ncbi:gram-negative pili assembly chaperone domain protein [Providencia rettgeri DSM 1131]|uniref:fimbrial biogenesis chaperone n=1 Tax=Providencia rettgeri TaxID=587 RepID=UPI000197C012|nr:molecular chaperone [Providencia rettgeri]EFE54099.1 gram-negative pili assembly chaperone domain protein [Providencia rettgeri DSM 1131]QXA57394.1 molecular chaperone [Providencia rettgeri]
MWKQFSLVSAILLSSINSAIAGIVIDGTRVVYQESDKKGVSIGVTSASSSKGPYLVKAYTSQNALDDSQEAPFVTSPSLFRLEPDNTQPVMILKKNTTLPTDRESVFYFRVVGIPSGKPLLDGGNQNVGGSLQVAGVSVIKLFYRPDNLPITQPDAMGKLTFSAVPNGLKVSNPTPYFITLNSVTVGGKAVNVSEKVGDSMIAPFGEQIYRLAPNQGQVEWKAIKDYGGTEVFHGTVQ